MPPNPLQALYTPKFITTRRYDVYPAIDPATTLSGTVSGKTVLVTGAGRGIGRAVAISFAVAGATRVVITSRTVAELDETEKQIHERVKTHSVEVKKVKCDISSESEVQNLFDSVGDDVIIDILVNNAAYLETMVPTAQSSVDEWWMSYTVNVKGTYLTCRQFLQRFKAGTIINTTSVGSTLTSPGMSSYQPTKTAVNRFTHFLHVENPHIRVFAYHPGSVVTELAKQLVPTGMLNDTPDLAGGFSVWLCGAHADFLRGRYVSSAWDVDQLLENSQKIVEKDLFITRVIMD